jgi:hypothetical protein
MAFLILPASCISQKACLARTAATKAVLTPRSIADAPIYTWIGNIPAWNRKMHVSGYRMGCDDGDPQGCVKEATEVVEQEGIAHIFLSMPVDAKRTPGDALVYSRLSVSRPFIAEVGFDDFVGRYGKLFFRPGVDPPSWLREVIHNVKSANPQLAFGITLYEDELDSPIVRAPDLPSDLARSVDYVHLFLHYRTDAPRFAEYVALTKELFPNAKVIAGLYAYDRINYIPCAPSNSRPCTRSEEIRLYQKAVSIAAQLLKEGRVAGIEFYPGFFGKENAWDGWKQPDYCSPSRVAKCIENTRAMRQSTLQTLSVAMGWK